MSRSTVELPKGEWVLLIQNRKQFAARITSENPSKHYYTVVEPFSDPPNRSDVDIGTLIVTTSRTFNFREEVDIYVMAFDHDGRMEISTDATFMDVFIQDQTTSPIEFFVTQELNDVVITAIADPRTKVLQLQAGHGFGLGDFLELYLETPVGPIIVKDFQQLRVVAFTATSITIQPFLNINVNPIYVVFSKRTTSDMAVDGSVTPQRFRMGPPNGLRWDLTRTMVAMVVTTNPDDALYGNLPALTNGVFFGFESDETQGYLVNIQANAGYRLTAYDVTYTTRSSGGGDFGVSIRKSFAGQDKYGVAIRLNGETSDEFVVYINDDLLLLTANAQKIMGHLVD